jgi:hypothetical protein
MHDNDDRWGTVSDAAQMFGVSVDTIRRRMKRGELETRREQTPQGFRWLIRFPDNAPPEPAQDTAGSTQTAAPIDQGSVVIYGPDPRDVLIETLQRELELRNREVSRLHEVIGQQAQAITQATAALPATVEPSHTPEGDTTTEQGSAGFWATIRRWFG